MQVVSCEGKHVDSLFLRLLPNYACEAVLNLFALDISSRLCL